MCTNELTMFVIEGAMCANDLAMFAIEGGMCTNELQFICILESQVVECSMWSFYTQRF